MQPGLKRALLILGFIVSVGLIATLIFTILFHGPSVEPTEPDQTTPPTTAGIGSLPGSLPGTPGTGSSDQSPTNETGSLPPSQIAQGGETFTQQLTTGAIMSPVKVGNIISYYDPVDGRFYTIDEAGNVNNLSLAQFPEAENVTIASNTDTAAIEFPDGSNILYDFISEEQITLPNHWEDFNFNKEGSSVATKSIGIDPSNRSLVVTSSDGSQTNVVTALGSNQDSVTINWSPNNEIVGFSDTSTNIQNGFGRKQIFLIGIDGEEHGALTVEGGNFSAQWSPTGSNILYSVADASNNNRPSLWYTNATGQIGSERKKFTVETWVEKCTFFDNRTIYCAVPRSVVNESGHDHNIISTYDDVYSIDIISGRTTLLAIPVIDLQMENLSISEDGGTLFFTDQNNRLNSLRLR